MSNLLIGLQELKEEVLEMMDLVTSQLIKCKEATITGDLDLVEEIVARDRRVNSMELKIDKKCENILALYSPVATDLRFVLASLKISNNLERIGDNAVGMAKIFRDAVGAVEPNLIEKFEVPEMFDMAITMLEDINKAMDREDTKIARKIFKKDDFLNQGNFEAPTRTIELIKDFPDKAQQILGMFSIVRKLERSGDHTKNMGEEIIFHLEAEVLKHKKDKKKEKKEKEKENEKKENTGEKENTEENE